ncbi:retrovirus-related pol polyprotein from transposon TNT 1-94, partial [Tanacetum coccineum]
GRQSSFAAGTSRTRANISIIGGNNSGQQRIVKCFNCQREGHMARQYPKPKRKRDATWFRDKVLLVKAQGSGKVLNEEELEFLTDPKVAEAKAVLMANLSSYRSDVLSEVLHSEITYNDMLNQSVQEMQYSEQTHLVNYLENEITSDSNIIPYSQYLLETQNAVVQDTNSLAQQDVMILSVFKQLSDQVTNCNKVNKGNLIANKSLSVELGRYKERVKLLEERQNVDLSTREKQDVMILSVFKQLSDQVTNCNKVNKGNLIANKSLSTELGRYKERFADFEKEINYLKQTLSEQSKEKELLAKTFNVLKNESKEKEAKNIDKEIALEKKVKELDNIVCKMETLMLEEESRSKMLLKQSDPMVLEKKVNTKPIDYAESNRLFEDFGKCFVPQHELSDEQALHPTIDQSTSLPLKIEAPWELPKFQAKDMTIKKLKAHIKRVNKTSTSESVKKDLYEIETINIKLEHRVTKLIAENEHLKHTYKQLYDSIKPSCVRAKEHTDSLVNQLNQKSVEVTDLNAQL